MGPVHAINSIFHLPPYSRAFFRKDNHALDHIRLILYRITFSRWNICIIGKLDVMQPIIFVHCDRVSHWVFTLWLDGCAHVETIRWMLDHVFHENTALIILFHDRKLVDPFLEESFRVLIRFPRVLLVMHWSIYCFVCNSLDCCIVLILFRLYIFSMSLVLEILFSWLCVR